MLKSVWTSDFWKQHKHVKDFGNIEEIDDDSDYKSDFDNEEEETNDILVMILKY